MPSAIDVPPTTALARFVRGVRFVQGVHEPYVRLPDGAIDLVFMGGRILAVGTRTSPLRRPASPAQSAAVVRFAPAGAYPFFGGSLGALTDRVVPLDEIWGRPARDLAEAVGEAPDPRTRLALIASTLTRWLASDAVYEPPAAVAIRRAIRLALAAPELPSVPSLAASVGLSSRQLRRVFSDVVGVSPKRWLRIVRFQRALAAARSSLTPAWSGIATAVGYADQAHLIAEFRAFSGVTPAAMSPVTMICAA